MTQTEKYIWLIDTIYRAKQISLQEISLRWRDYMGLNCDEGLHRASFTRWKDAIFEQFGVIISCQRKGGYLYYIENPEILEKDSLKKWMLDTIATGNLVSTSISLSDRILVNNIPSGNDHLHTIIAAMKTNHKVEITHRRFGYEQGYTHRVEPYCVKLHDSRWYMLGRLPKGKMRLFSLDRIEKTELSPEEFIMPENFDAESFFAPYFGVFLEEGTKPCRIIVRAYGDHKYYMDTLPIHESQEKIEEGAGYADFELFVVPSFDLVMKLMSFGTMVEVLWPKHLREEMRKSVERLSEMYKEK